MAVVASGVSIFVILSKPALMHGLTGLLHTPSKQEVVRIVAPRRTISNLSPIAGHYKPSSEGFLFPCWDNPQQARYPFAIVGEVSQSVEIARSPAMLSVQAGGKG
jgi:hypothetical protein